MGFGVIRRKVVALMSRHLAINLKTWKCTHMSLGPSPVVGVGRSPALHSLDMLGAAEEAAPFFLLQPS